MIEYFKSLKKFNSIEVTLQIGCSLQCKYCPQNLLIKNYNKKDRVKSMSLDSFKRYIESVRIGGGIVFSGMSEPFLNKDCAKMIKYAYDKGYKISLFTTLMGMSLEDLEIIKHVHFDYVTLHVPDTEGNSKFTLNEEYDRVLEKFCSTVQVNNYSCHGTVHDRVKQYIDSEFLSTALMNRAGNLEYEHLKTFAPKGEIVCQVGTIEGPGCWAPEVLPDGTVTLCCMDYAMRHVLGNLNENSVSEILNSDEANLVMQGMKQDTMDTLCRTCSSAVPMEDLGVSKLKKAMEQDETNEVFHKIKTAENICIYGLGKYFRDTYFSLKYNEVIHANLFSDSKISETDYITEGEVVEPEQLVNYDHLLVITYVKNPASINEKLQELGITNYINIMDIFREISNME